MDIKCLLSLQGKLHGFGVTHRGKMVTLTRRIPEASVAGISVLKQTLYWLYLPLKLQCYFTYLLCRHNHMYFPHALLF